MALLFSPVRIAGIELANRICVPPMCCCLACDGLATDALAEHYEMLSGTGAGLVVLEATAVAPNGRITERCLELCSEVHAQSLAEILVRSRAAATLPETKFFIQLSHAGRKGSRRDPQKGRGILTPEEGGFPLIAPSAVAFDENSPVPSEMTEDDIAEVIGQFAQAAKRARRIGFDGIQIHAAHGYLLHQFLSPVTNRRTDNWGGSLENRMRFALAVIDAVKSQAKDIPVMLRLSACDWIEGGWRLEDTVVFARKALEHGVCAVDVSSGGIDPAQKLPEPSIATHAAFTHEVREKISALTFISGFITEPQQAEQILKAQDADVVCIGREMIRNPGWVHSAALALHGVMQMPGFFASGF